MFLVRHAMIEDVPTLLRMARTAHSGNLPPGAAPLQDRVQLLDALVSTHHRFGEAGTVLSIKIKVNFTDQFGHSLSKMRFPGDRAQWIWRTLLQQVLCL